MRPGIVVLINIDGAAKKTRYVVIFNIKVEFCKKKLFIGQNTFRTPVSHLNKKDYQNVS